MLGVKEAEHVLIKKVVQLFRNMLSRSHNLAGLLRTGGSFPALFTRRMFVQLSQLPSIRVLAQPMRSAEILVSPLPQQVQLVNPENSYLRRLKRSDSKTRRISSIGRWAQGRVRAVGTNRRFCGDRFHDVICIGAPMPILFVETSRRVRRLQIPTTPVIAHSLRLRLS